MIDHKQVSASDAPYLGGLSRFSTAPGFKDHKRDLNRALGFEWLLIFLPALPPPGRRFGPGKPRECGDGITGGVKSEWAPIAFGSVYLNH